jgi:hypothetical protein
MRIQPIVEGHGEVEAFPVLLRRLRDEAAAWSIDIGKPIRQKRTELVQQETVSRAVEVALLQPQCGAILILFDADDDCPAQLGPTVQQWADAASAGRVPCAVVLAKCEYEAWFLSVLDPPHPNPEAVRGAKEELAHRLSGQYSPTVDQAPLSAALNLPLAHQRCRSFRRLVRAFGVLAASIDVCADPWPPTTWMDGA